MPGRDPANLAAASPLAAHLVKALRETTFFHEGCGLGFQLSVQQVAAQVQERERSIGDQLGR